MSIEAYQHNLDVTTHALRAALTRFRAFRAQELILRDEDGVWRTKGKDAAAVYGDVVRLNSDWEHWAARLRMAQTEKGVAVTAPSAPDAVPVQQDMRFPAEREDEEAPF